MNRFSTNINCNYYNSPLKQKVDNNVTLLHAKGDSIHLERNYDSYVSSQKDKALQNFKHQEKASVHQAYTHNEPLKTCLSSPGSKPKNMERVNMKVQFHSTENETKYLNNILTKKQETKLAKSQPNFQRPIQKCSNINAIANKCNLDSKRARSFTHFDQDENHHNIKDFNKTLKELFTNRRRVKRRHQKKDNISYTLDSINTRTKSNNCNTNYDQEKTFSKKYKFCNEKDNQKRYLNASEVNYDAVFFNNVCVTGKKLTLWKKIKKRFISSTTVKDISHETVGSIIKENKENVFKVQKSEKRQPYFCYPCSYEPSPNNWNITKVRHVGRQELDYTIPDNTIPDHTTQDCTIPTYTIPDPNLLDCTIPDRNLANGIIPGGNLLDGTIPTYTIPDCPMPDCTTSRSSSFDKEVHCLDVFKSIKGKPGAVTFYNSCEKKIPCEPHQNNICGIRSPPCCEKVKTKTCSPAKQKETCVSKNLLTNNDNVCECSGKFMNNLINKCLTWCERAPGRNCCKAKETNNKKGCKVSHKRSIKTQVTVRREKKCLCHRPNTAPCAINSCCSRCCELEQSKSLSCTNAPKNNDSIKTVTKGCLKRSKCDNFEHFPCNYKITEKNLKKNKQTCTSCVRFIGAECPADGPHNRITCKHCKAKICGKCGKLTSCSCKDVADIDGTKKKDICVCTPNVSKCGTAKFVCTSKKDKVICTPIIEKKIKVCGDCGKGDSISCKHIKTNACIQKKDKCDSAKFVCTAKKDKIVCTPIIDKFVKVCGKCGVSPSKNNKCAVCTPITDNSACSICTHSVDRCNSAKFVCTAKKDKIVCTPIIDKFVKVCGNCSACHSNKSVSCIQNVDKCGLAKFVCTLKKDKIVCKPTTDKCVCTHNVDKCGSSKFICSAKKDKIACDPINNKCICTQNVNKCSSSNFICSAKKDKMVCKPSTGKCVCNLNVGKCSSSKLICSAKNDSVVCKSTTDKYVCTQNADKCSSSKLVCSATKDKMVCKPTSDKCICTQKNVIKCGSAKFVCSPKNSKIGCTQNVGQCGLIKLFCRPKKGKIVCEQIDKKICDPKQSKVVTPICIPMKKISNKQIMCPSRCYSVNFKNIRCKCKGFLVRQRCKCRKKKKKERRCKKTEYCDQLLMHSLRRKPCPIIYCYCPEFYPHFLSCLTYMTRGVHIFLYMLAICVWCPCFISFELCRCLFCSCF